MNHTISDVAKRLQDRYQQLVHQHTKHAHPNASGPRFWPVPAAWRFYHHPRITFRCLAQPLLPTDADQASRHGRDFALVCLDWSWLVYHHPCKTDRVRGPSGVLGYQLLSALLLSDRDGQPLVPLAAAPGRRTPTVPRLGFHTGVPPSR
jgi:hypothetical protein